MLPNYLNFGTCLGRCHPFNINNFKMFGAKHNFFFLLIFILELLFKIKSKLFNALFKFISSYAIIAISSANLSICILTPFTLIPG